MKRINGKMATLTVNIITTAEMTMICFLFDPRNFKQRNPCSGSTRGQSPTVIGFPVRSLGSEVLVGDVLRLDKPSWVTSLSVLFSVADITHNVNEC